MDVSLTSLATWFYFLGGSLHTLQQFQFAHLGEVQMHRVPSKKTKDRYRHGYISFDE